MSLRGLFTFRGQSSSRTDAVMAVIAFIGFIGLWYAVAFFGIVPQRFLPLPTEVIAALERMIVDGDFLSDIWISVLRVWAAFLLSVVMAIPLGIFMSSYRIVGTLTEPIIDFIRYLPVPALVPLLIIWLGIEEASKIAVLWMGTFFQLVLLVADDAKRVPREFVEIGYTLGAKNRQILRDIVLRAMLPSTIDNLRITLGWCWTYLIIAEIVAANSGIGHAIWSMRRFVKTPEVMAGILTVGIIGLVTDQLIRYAHRRYFRYL
ncbi:MAG: ABC transporter permease [Rhodospirillaceae bacterium]|nr:ABC transporter permease [Rhodospirillaceae bacterium]